MATVVSGLSKTDNDPITPMHSTLRCCLTTAIVTSLSLSLAAIAQTTGATANQSGNPDETVQLSAFTVHEKLDNSYIASEAVTGPRVATKIADLPYAVSVITSEFMKDFDIFNLAGDLNGFSSSLTGVSDEGTFILRGLTTNNNFYLRNGFYRLGMVDRVNTDRVEVIKGPNSAIYGATNPAGMVNIVSRAPKFTPSQSIGYTAGPDDSNRIELSVNQPLGTIGGVRLANLMTAQGTDKHSLSSYPTGSQTRIFDDTLLAKFPDGSSLTAEFEWSHVFVTPGNSTSMIFEGAKGALTPVTRRDVVRFNDVGPDTQKDRSSYSAYLTYEKRYNRVWSSRVNGYWYRRPEIQFNAAGNSTVFDPVAKTFSARSVQWDQLNQDGGAFQIDTLADYALFDGKVKSKTLFTLDYSQNWREREVKDFNTNLFPAIPAISIVTPNYVVPPRSAFGIVNRNDKTRADNKGVFLSEQVRMFNERLISFVSLRHDAVSYTMNFGNQYNAKGGTLKTAGQVLHYGSTAWSPSLGTNYKVTRQLAAYASYSQSFAPQLQVSKLGDPPLPNERAKGYDYGVKASMLDDKLVFTLGGYYIDRTGIKTTVTDPFTGLTTTVAGGATNAKGVEFEGSWRMTENLTVLFNYGYVNARITNNGKTVTDVGQMPVGVPIDGASVSTTYRFTGALKGLSSHLNVQYVGNADPFSTQTTFQRAIVSPSYVLVNPGLSYTWKMGPQGLRHAIRFSAKNVLNREYLTSGYNVGAPRGYYFTYTLNH